MAASSNENGYTMLETIMYISLLIILGASAATYISNTFNRYKTGRVAQQVVDLKKAILQYTAASPDYSNLRISKDGDKNGMIEDRALPLDMRDGFHALGGKILIGPSINLIVTSDDKKYNFMYYITFENLPQKSCMEVVTQGQYYGNGSDMDTLIINDNYIWRYEYSLFPTSGYTAPQGNTTPDKIDVAQALNACNLKNNNKITWIFS